eukprot:2793762-Pleurochrysis_carterae.AAC.1
MDESGCNLLSVQLRSSECTTPSTSMPCLEIYDIVPILVILIKSSARQQRIGGIGNSYPVATSVPGLDRCIADMSIRAVGCADIARYSLILFRLVTF